MGRHHHRHTTITTTTNHYQHTPAVTHSLQVRIMLVIRTLTWWGRDAVEWKIPKDDPPPPAGPTHSSIRFDTSKTILGPWDCARALYSLTLATRFDMWTTSWLSKGCWNWHRFTPSAQVPHKMVARSGPQRACVLAGPRSQAPPLVGGE